MNVNADTAPRVTKDKQILNHRRSSERERIDCHTDTQGSRTDRQGRACKRYLLWLLRTDSFFGAGRHRCCGKPVLCAASLSLDAKPRRMITLYFNKPGGIVLQRVSHIRHQQEHKARRHHRSARSSRPAWAHCSFVRSRRQEESHPGTPGKVPSAFVRSSGAGTEIQKQRRKFCIRERL